MWYFLYNFFLTAAFALALPFIPLLLLLGSRYRDGYSQRLGIYPKAILSSLACARPVWIHAASVGEVRSTEPLVRELKARWPERKILLSTFTSTGHHIARGIGGVDAAIFLPLDLLWIVRGALQRFRPAILLIIETEIWPNLVREAFRLGIPTLLLSGRLSPKAYSRYSICRPLFSRVLKCFTMLGMQSAADASRIEKLGAEIKRVSVVGSLKFSLPKAQERSAAAPSTASLGKPWLVAGSSHRGEEEILLKGLALARARFPKLSMILAPRHPERFAEVEKLLIGSPFEFQRKSRANGRQLFAKDILLLDTVGELREFFAVGDIAFVGGSLVDAGGHNILEPARYYKPILFGPNMGNFESIAEQMREKGAAIEVGDAEDLASALVTLLGDSEKRRRMGELAFQIVTAHDHAFKRNFLLAERFL